VDNHTDPIGALWAYLFGILVGASLVGLAWFLTAVL